MSGLMIFPDTRGAIFALIDGTEHFAMPDVFVTVRAAYLQTADEYGRPSTGDGVEVVITQEAGTQGWVDRVDRISLDVYAPGEQAMNVLNSLLGLLVGFGVETPNSVYLDEVSVDQTPHEMPYPSDTLNHAMCRLLVVVRPVDDI